jgi:cytochrome c
MKVLLLAAALSLMTPGLALAAGDADAGKAVFKKCAACHMIGEGAKDRVGPVLNELFGRVAGSTPYNYSKAMQEAGAGGLVWTPETVAHFLHKPKDFVPGTKMTFAGLTDETQLADLIAYLATFSPDYVPDEADDAGASSAPAQ